MKPIILTVLAGYHRSSPPKFGLKQSYFRALYEAGANIFSIARPNSDNLNRLVSSAQGIFLAGGSDLNPMRYLEENEFSRWIDEERDRVELALARIAFEQKIPILGVCRGMQVMNVALGGSLHQDVHKETRTTINHNPHLKPRKKKLPLSHVAHTVRIVPGTKLARIIGAKRKLGVNSLHHQGIEMIGDGLIPSAYAPDGLIEGIELRRHPFYIGVEWHPEELTAVDERWKKLFSAFVDVARNIK